MVLLLVLLLGFMALAGGLYCLAVLDYHERASTPLGIGTVCLLGGTEGAIVVRLKAHPAAFLTLMVLGLVADGEEVCTS